MRNIARTSCPASASRSLGHCYSFLGILGRAKNWIGLECSRRVGYGVPSLVKRAMGESNGILGANVLARLNITSP